MIHFDRMMCVWWVALVLAAGARAYIFKRTDCQVTEWGPWSTEPFGFGQVSRERTIIRHPTNGGTDCPQEMEDIKISGRRATVQSTAKSMATNFMGQNSPTLSRVKRDAKSVGRLRDLLVIMDGSGSIKAAPFQVAKDQLARLLGTLCPVPDPFKKYQQAAMITFSRNVTEIFDFNAKANTVAVQQGIIGASYPGGGTHTAAAFDYARTKMFTAAKGMRSRSDVKQEVLLLTDGRSNCGACTITAAKKLAKTAKVFGLMIGSHSTAGINELTQYVSYPKNQHLFAIENVNELKLLVDLVEKQLKIFPCTIFDF